VQAQVLRGGHLIFPIPSRMFLSSRSNLPLTGDCFGKELERLATTLDPYFFSRQYSTAAKITISNNQMRFPTAQSIKPGTSLNGSAPDLTSFKIFKNSRMVVSFFTMSHRTCVRCKCCEGASCSSPPKAHLPSHSLRSPALACGANVGDYSGGRCQGEQRLAMTSFFAINAK